MLISHKTCFLILLRVPGRVHGQTLWLILPNKQLVNLKIVLIRNSTSRHPNSLFLKTVSGIVFSLVAQYKRYHR